MYHQDIFRLSLVVLSSLSLNKQLASDQIIYASASATAPDSAPEVSTSWTTNEDSWNYWWSYSGVSGPAYWGLLNLDWFMCDKGRRQSPINIETNSLVYDPHLTPLRADNNLISGLLYNDGHALIFNVSALRVTHKDNTQTNFQQNNRNEPFNNSMVRRRRSVEESDSNIVSSAALSQSAPPLPHENIRHLSDSSTFLKELSNSVGLSISEANMLESPLDKSLNVENSLANAADIADLSENSAAAEAEQNQVNEADIAKVHFTGAGLAYSYKFEALHLRFGLDSTIGSEHRINSVGFGAEIQVIAYNSFLYKSYSEASTKPSGLIAISVLIESLPLVNKTTNEQLDNLLNTVGQLKHRGYSNPINDFNLSALLPTTDHYITYEGSLTVPGCHESVTWILLNKPLYIAQSNRSLDIQVTYALIKQYSKLQTRQQLDILRSISADEKAIASTGTLIAGNIRPVQPVNGRPIRTNIKPPSRSEKPETCQQLRTKYEYKIKR